MWRFFKPVFIAQLVSAQLLAGSAMAQGTKLSPADMDAVRQIARAQFDTHHLNALIYELRIGGDPVLTEAMGEAMSGVPATPDGWFRNGAVALTYVAAIALKLAEEGIVDLDAPIARWLPDLPGADQATIRMLANMTAGYPDHVANHEGFEKPFLANPFRHWTPQDLIDISLSTPRLFAPGENWDYSHSGYVILGQVLEAASGQSLAALMDRYVLTPLGLDHTRSFDNATIPAPTIHGFTAERGLWEDATHWNPSWTLPSGAIQVTTISDMAKSFDAIVGHDGFLTSQAREQMIGPALVGFGAPLEGCPNCRALSVDFSYGLGAVLVGDWVFQTPLFGGYAGAVASLPEGRAKGPRITIAVLVTHTEASIKDWGGDSLPNFAIETIARIATHLRPDNPPRL